MGRLKFQQELVDYILDIAPTANLKKIDQLYELGVMEYVMNISSTVVKHRMKKTRDDMLRVGEKLIELSAALHELRETIEEQDD